MKHMILLTGATGYVGGRLLKNLENSGYEVRCLVRRPEFMQARVSDKTEIVKGDVLNKTSLSNAMQGVEAAYYLVHSMGSNKDFEELDRTAANNFAEAAVACKVRRLIYLGGLGDNQNEELSPHLRSRHEVGKILRSYKIEVIELRASVVIGSGSLSFEMIRALVERLPIMITPRWVSIVSQPIAIKDLLDYLVGALRLQVTGNQVFEIGAADKMSYGDLMQEYARLRNLKRIMIPVPVLTPKLSSLWLGLVTPLYSRVGRKLIDSIRHPTVVRDDSASRVFGLKPKSVKEAIAEALRNEEQEIAESRWFDALSSAGAERNWGGVRFGNRLVDRRQADVKRAAEIAFQPIQRIGGETGWYFADWLWRLRGFIDLLFGGVGLRRGRKHRVQIFVGDTIDWWRVVAFEPNRLLRLEDRNESTGPRVAGVRGLEPGVNFDNCADCDF